MIILNSWKDIHKYYIPFLPIDHFKSYTLDLATVWCAGDRPSHPLYTPAVWSGEPCTAVWWWSRPEQRCCGATESCPCRAQKTLLWLQQIHIQSSVFSWFCAISRELMSLAKCWTYFALTLASVVLPKFSGLSPVGIMEHDRQRDILISKMTWGKTPPPSSEAFDEAMSLLRVKPSPSKFNDISLISMKFHTGLEHRSHA